MTGKVETGQVLQLVLATLRDEADDLGYEELAQAGTDTPLYGGEAGIDSLSLVRLIVAVEGAAARAFGRHVTLADERAMSMRHSPFRTVGSLAQLLHERLEAADA